MKEKKIIVNFGMNLLRMGFGLLIPIVLLPHLSKTLGSYGMGVIQYFESIVNYLLLFSTIGIPSYGVIQIAKTRDNKKKLTIEFMELLILLVISSLLIAIVYFLFIFKINVSERKLFIIYGVYFFSQSINIDWFFQGLEEQVYITLRIVFSKIIMIFIIIHLISNNGDLVKYGIILTVFSIFLNIVNFKKCFTYLEKDRDNLKKIQLKKHLRPCFIICLGSFFSSTYNVLDSIMLGKMVEKKYLGYYSISSKFTKFSISIVSAINIIVLPRLVNVFSKKEYGLYNLYCKKIFEAFLFFSFPMTIFLYLMADEIIMIFSGKEFIESILTLKILSITVPIITMAYFLRFSILYINKAEKIYTISAFTASLSNFLFNFYFIPRYYQNGAAFGSILAELSSVIIMLVFGYIYLKNINIINLGILKIFATTFFTGILIIFLKQNNIIMSLKIKFIITIFLSALSYIILSIILKVSIVMDGINMMKQIFNKTEES